MLYYERHCVWQRLFQSHVRQTSNLKRVKISTSVHCMNGNGHDNGLYRSYNMDSGHLNCYSNLRKKTNFRRNWVWGQFWSHDSGYNYQYAWTNCYLNQNSMKTFVILPPARIQWLKTHLDHSYHSLRHYGQNNSTTRNILSPGISSTCVTLRTWDK